MWDQPRDPARIEPTLKLIEILWKRYPDMRLGQLLINVAGNPSNFDRLWNMEESEWQTKAALAIADDFGVGKRPVNADTERAS